MKIAITLICAVLLSLPLLAKEATPVARDPVTEARLIRLATDMRCLVCQNESLAASDADLAKDLREEIRQLIAQGKTDKEIIDYMVHRYGNFIRYKPPVDITTYALWFGPFLLLLGALGVLIAVVRQRNAAAEEAPLTLQQQQQATELLRE
ncbi:cytochrome c-type biogenesis protein CcmH precursor [Ferrovum sp. JA12]|uniref:cytochrome c-type biogenesis protein n=1 Tax=Ferrovum sp. JA12 TaxID=1356299 RepID=UPI0007024C70|nr:cytochrome c-type biogenesis protein [Ferrovum sp. JA12]KRH78055.1 cytochrome c-type biogenesis protein CcmH precursor [Ferrovum sp. JA12]